MCKPTFSCNILAGIFSSHNSHIRAEVNPHAAFVHHHQDGFAVNIWAGIMHDFLSESHLFPRGSLHRFTGHFWRKFYQECWRKYSWHSRETCGSRMTGLQVILHIRSENNSLPLRVIAGLNEAGMWLVLLGHRTAHHWTYSCGATWKSWFTHCHLIWKRIVLAIELRQQQPPGRNFTFLSTHYSICFIDVGFVLRSVAVRWTICSNCKKYNFFRILVFALFPTIGSPTLMVSGTTRRHIRHTVLWK